MYPLELNIDGLIPYGSWRREDNLDITNEYEYLDHCFTNMDIDLFKLYYKKYCKSDHRLFEINYNKKN